MQNELIYLTGFSDNGSVFFDPNGPSFLNTLTDIVPGLGYWLKVTEPQVMEQVGTLIPEDFTINKIKGASHANFDFPLSHIWFYLKPINVFFC